MGKAMRPDVAAAFDRTAAAAARAGIDLVINSVFRSDTEQARLWQQNPDPRWVAPPGTSPLRDRARPWPLDRLRPGSPRTPAASASSITFNPLGARRIAGTHGLGAAFADGAAALHA